MRPRQLTIGPWTLRLDVFAETGGTDLSWEVTLRHGDDHPDANPRLITAGVGPGEYGTGVFVGATETLRSIVAIEAAS